MGKVDVLRPYIGGEGVAVIAGVKEDSPASDLDQRREAPILLHRGIAAESIIEDGDLGFGAEGRFSHAYQGGGTDEGARNEPCQFEPHGRSSLWLRVDEVLARPNHTVAGA